VAWRSDRELYDIGIKVLPEFLQRGGLNRISDRLKIRNCWMRLLIDGRESRIDAWDCQRFFCVMFHG